MRAPALTFAHARRLRRDMSLPEVLLWDCLRAGRLEALRFRRQHAAGPYVLDFYCPEAKLAVEVDGAHHDLAGQMEHDKRRDRWLSEQGIRTLRIPATDILNEKSLEGVLIMIAHAASSSTAKPPPPPPSAVPLPRKRGRINGGDGLDLGSSPAKRGRGTAEGGGGGEACCRGGGAVDLGGGRADGAADSNDDREQTP
ncbi:endonuclease domain-containing protein [Mesorhizobium sp. Root157]|uniref:endonuclease domain-containing protein n=1 Tax=Mesorhizobium sp. Root157 TaxID=1736477 RepID=UPI0009E711FC|nr:DUF559 domain-containing protein [Mesorhizobium sp. Root157]